MSVNNFEGVVQYRLLGSHPAASGRYYTTGFSGNTISVREFVGRLISEHRINVTRYKLQIKKMLTDKELEKSNIHEELMGENNFIRSYDRLAVTITQRQVGEPLIITIENSEREWNDRNGRDYNNEELPIAELELMRYSEQSRSYSLQDKSSPHSSVDLQHDNCSNADGDCVNNLMKRTTLHNISTYHNELLARHSKDNKPLMPSATHSPVEQINTTLARATDHDNRALERIAIVAGKVLPIKSREHITLEASASDCNDHICILCDLPPFQPRRTTCCRRIVCNMCWLTAQNMMPHDGDCPVCGAETLQISLRRNSKRTRNVESNNIYDSTNRNIYNYNKKLHERTKCVYENVKNEQIQEKFDSKFTRDMHDKESEEIADFNAFVVCDNDGSNCTKRASERSQATGPLQTNEENNELIRMRKNSPTDKLILSEITSEVIAFERQLRLNLDKTLSFIDLCDIDGKKESLYSCTNSNIKDKRHKLISKENTLNSEHSAVLRRADALFLLT